MYINAFFPQDKAIENTFLGLREVVTILETLVSSNHIKIHIK